MSLKGQKLSGPQVKLLRELPTKVVANYPPIVKLVALGLASRVEGSGKLEQPKYVRTEAGEAWVATNPPETNTP
jgi:hypothetical protein